MSALSQFKRKRNWLECLCQVPCPGCYDPREVRAPHPYPGKLRSALSKSEKLRAAAAEELEAGAVVH